MNTIKQIEITNYKGIEEMKIPCKSINIIVGPNNTGKSSILQSIWMAISSLNKFEDTLGTEFSDVVLDHDDNMKFLLHKDNNKADILLTLSNKKNILLTLQYLERNYPGEIAEEIFTFLYSDTIKELSNIYFEIENESIYRTYRLLRDLKNKIQHLKLEESSEKIDRMLDEVSESIGSQNEKVINDFLNSKKLFLKSQLDGNLIDIHTITNIYNGEIPLQNKRTDIDIPEIPLIFSSTFLNDNIYQLYQKLLDVKKISTSLETLKENIPYFEDIREKDNDLIVLLKNIDNPLPISMMGEGFRALLKLSFISTLIKDGIVLLEEPENSMHPGYLELLAKEIVSNSESSQFFITTHSLELLKYILDVAEQTNKINSIHVLRLHRLSEGFIEREICPGAEAQEEIKEIETDMRGF